MLNDANARQQALDIHNSYIVQAPAGSGKTGLLTQRFLALLAVVQEPEECLAITFTRKAQAEMQTRICAELLAAQIDLPVTTSQLERQSVYQQVLRNLAKQALAQDAKRGWNLLANPKRLKIKTIDALCASITNKMPLTARFGGQLTVTDDVNSCFDLAIERVLADPTIKQPYRAALNKVLQHLDNNYQLVKRLFLTMLPVREQWLPYMFPAQAERERQVLTSGLQQLANGLLLDLKDAQTDFDSASAIAALPKVGQMAAEYLLSANIALATAGQQSLTDAGQQSLTDVVQHNSLLCALVNYPTWPEPELADLPVWLAYAELLLTKEGEWRKQVTVQQGFPAPGSFKNKVEREFYKAHKQQMQQILALLAANVPNNFDKFKANLLLIRRLPPLTYSEQQWELVQALTVILPYLVAQLMLVYKEQGRVDFSEVSIAAQAALGSLDSPSDLALALDYKLKHILVDEFQDTSITQFKLLEQLAMGWSPGDARTLFLVGDPMQSIYRFRQAEVSLFLQAEQYGINEINLTPLRLTSNFRAQPELVAWHNRTFSQIFPPEHNINLGAISFVPAVAVVQDKQSATTLAELRQHQQCQQHQQNQQHQLYQQTGIKFFVAAEQNDQQEAEEIIKLVKQIRADQPNASIAVLVRVKQHLADVLIACQRHKIAYYGVEIATLLNSMVVRDLLALTNALLHLGDRIAWLAILRAPWCSLTLADLHALCVGEQAVAREIHENVNLTVSSRKTPSVYPGSNSKMTQLYEPSQIDTNETTFAEFCIWQQLQNFTDNPCISVAGKCRLQRVVPILAAALANKGKLSWSMLVQQCWQQLTGAQCLAMEPELADAMTFFALLRQYEDSRELTKPGFLQQRLQTLFAKPTQPDPNALQLMTIHKAKGLEFDHVILPGLGKRPRASMSKLLNWEQRISSTGSSYLLLAPIKAVGAAADLLYEFLQYTAKQKDNHELVRLFYVAATRAKAGLYGFGHLVNDKPPGNSLLDLLWNKVEMITMSAVKLYS